MKLIKFKYNFSFYAPALVYLKAVNDAEWDIINRGLKDEVELYIGEMSGKHSEVVISMGEVNKTPFSILSVISEDDNVIKDFKETIGSNYFGNFDLYGILYDYYAELEDD